MSKRFNMSYVFTNLTKTLEAEQQKILLTQQNLMNSSIFLREVFHLKAFFEAVFNFKNANVHFLNTA